MLGNVRFDFFGGKTNDIAVLEITSPAFGWISFDVEAVRQILIVIVDLRTLLHTRAIRGDRRGTGSH